MGFIYRALTSKKGREFKMILGALLGLFGVGSASWVFIGIGAFLIITGYLNICLLGPLFGKPIKASR